MSWSLKEKKIVYIKKDSMKMNEGLELGVRYTFDVSKKRNTKYERFRWIKKGRTLKSYSSKYNTIEEKKEMIKNFYNGNEDKEEMVFLTTLGDLEKCKDFAIRYRKNEKVERQWRMYRNSLKTSHGKGLPVYMCKKPYGYRVTFEDGNRYNRFLKKYKTKYNEDHPKFKKITKIYKSLTSKMFTEEQHYETAEEFANECWKIYDERLRDAIKILKKETKKLFFLLLKQ